MHCISGEKMYSTEPKKLILHTAISFLGLEVSQEVISGRSNRADSEICIT